MVPQLTWTVINEDTAKQLRKMSVEDVAKWDNNAACMGGIRMKLLINCMQEAGQCAVVNRAWNQSERGCSVGLLCGSILISITMCFDYLIDPRNCYTWTSQYVSFLVRPYKIVCYRFVIYYTTILDSYWTYATREKRYTDEQACAFIALLHILVNNIKCEL